MNSPITCSLRLFACLVMLLWAAFAQPVDTGVIAGRILNVATGEYVRNAQVRIAATGEVTGSEAGGYYRFSNLPLGEVTLVVTYIGYPAVTASVRVIARATTTHDFQLGGAPETAATPDGKPIRLDAFVVATEREGDAKAIMEQRNSMNVTNSIASEVFGDNAEGNIGEFMRNMPGVYLETLYGEVRNVGLGGLGPEYTSVTMDGMTFSGADANVATGTGINTRAITFEMTSLNSMDSIEVSKTISADVDANSPGGTINLRTKRAFDREGRRVSWQVNVAAHSEEMTFGKTPGPDEPRQSRKLRPGGIFEYSDVFMNKRLGIVLNVSESNVYQETLISTLTYNRTPTAADPRGQVITALNFQHAPRFNKRFTTTLTSDFRATPRLALSLGTVYSWADLWTPQRAVTFNTGARTSIIGTDPAVSFTTNSTAANVALGPIATAKLGETFTLLPKFEYKRNDFTLEGRFAYSDSTSWYSPLTRRHSIRDINSATASNANFHVERPSLTSAAWMITQISGPDIASGASFTNAARDLSVNDARFSRGTFFSGELVGSLKTHRLLPVAWKAGLKSRYEVRKFEDERLLQRYTYTGSGGSSTGVWAGYRSPNEYDLGMIDSRITSLSGGNLFMPNLARLAQLYRDEPENFRQNITAANYYNAKVALRRKYDEEINAAYLMGTSTLGRATFRAGLRWEDTSADSTEANARSSREVQAAGYPVSAGIATTVEGVDYQFFSRPRVQRRGGYDNYFPSGSFKYRFTPNLDLHLGFSSTIRRPNYADVAGVWLVNDELLRVTAPNAGVQPETSRNYAARLAYYFEPVGQISVTATENNVKSLIVSDQLTAEEFGYRGEQDLSSYTFITTSNSADRVKIRGLEFAYSQSLAFLGAAFRRLSVRANYTRSYANFIKINLIPYTVNGGLNFTLGRLNAYVNANWTDSFPLSATGLTYRRHRTNLDAGGSWRLSNHLSLSVSARNLLNTPYINMQWVEPNPPVWTRHEITGVSWTLALKGTY